LTPWLREVLIQFLLGLFRGHRNPACILALRWGSADSMNVTLY
jgi:hypothetical protein